MIPVALRSNVLHLDCALALIRPGLLVWCPEKLIDGLPMSLRGWDAIAVSKDEANLLATNGLILEEGRMIVDADNARVIEELRKRRVDVIPLPFDGPIGCGGGLRCAHHPLLRESVLRLGALLGRAIEDHRLGRCSGLPEVNPEAAHDHRHLAADEAQQHPAKRSGGISPWRMKLWPARRNVVAQNSTQARVIRRASAAPAPAAAPGAAARTPDTTPTSRTG